MKAVKHMWNCIKDNGFIKKGEYKGIYSINEESFITVKTDSEIPSGCEYVKEQNYKFIVKDDMLAKLSNIIESKELMMDDTWAKESLLYISNIKKSGINEISLSRPSKRVHWGIGVPDDSEQTIYVWIDALTNYYTTIGYPKYDSELASSMTHIIGKDILKFHSVYWPLFLLSSNLPLPKEIIVHHHWLMNNVR